MTSKGLRELSIRDPVNPEWFDSDFDLVIAFLLPFVDGVGRDVAVPFFIPHSE